MSVSKLNQIAALLATGVLLGGVGCGDAGSNNDQGASVLAVRYCADSMCVDGETGKIVPLSTDVATGLAPFDGQTVITFMEVENRLAAQFVRIDRIDCAYTIPGASVNVPDDSFGVGAVIPATQVNDPSDPTNPTAPPLQGSRQIMGFEIVSPDLYAFLNANRNSLPELPFRAVATCFAVGVTQSGDTVETNYLNYTVQFGDPAECCTGTGITPTGGGFQEGPGVGGDLSTFDPNEPAAGTAPATEGASSDDEGSEG